MCTHLGLLLERVIIVVAVAVAVAVAIAAAAVVAAAAAAAAAAAMCIGFVIVIAVVMCRQGWACVSRCRSFARQSEAWHPCASHPQSQI